MNNKEQLPNAFPAVGIFVRVLSGLLVTFLALIVLLIVSNPVGTGAFAAGLGSVILALPFAYIVIYGRVPVPRPGSLPSDFFGTRNRVCVCCSVR